MREVGRAIGLAMGVARWVWVVPPWLLAGCQSQAWFAVDYGSIHHTYRDGHICGATLSGIGRI